MIKTIEDVKRIAGDFFSIESAQVVQTIQDIDEVKNITQIV